MSRVSPRARLWILSGLNVFVIFGLIVMITSGLGIVDQHAQELSRAEQQRNVMAKQLETFKNATTKTTEQLEVVEGNLNNMIVTPSTVGARLDELQRIAERSGVIQQIDVDVSDETAVGEFIPFTLRATGDFPSVLNHLRALERTPFVFNIREPELKAQTTSTRPNLTPDLRDDLPQEPEERVQMVINAAFLWKPSE